MSRAYLSLGSNLDDRYSNLRHALDRLQEHMTITAVSPVYATEPWGLVDQPPFLNICVAVVVDVTPTELLTTLKTIETEMGRRPTVRWGPRIIDIDILFYDDLVLQTEELVIPHPAMGERAFVLAPLAIIIPDFIHPLTGNTIRQMMERVDTSTVERLFEMPFPTPTGETRTPA